MLLCLFSFPCSIPLTPHPLLLRARRPDQEIIDATMLELERLFPTEIRADGSMAKVGGARLWRLGGRRQACPRCRGQLLWGAGTMPEGWGHALSGRQGCGWGRQQLQPCLLLMDCKATGPLLLALPPPRRSASSRSSRPHCRSTSQPRGARSTGGGGMLLARAVCPNGSKRHCTCRIHDKNSHAIPEVAVQLRPIHPPPLTPSPFHTTGPPRRRPSPTSTSRATTPSRWGSRHGGVSVEGLLCAHTMPLLTHVTT